MDHEVSPAHAGVEARRASTPRPRTRSGQPRVRGGRGVATTTHKASELPALRICGGRGAAPETTTILMMLAPRMRGWRVLPCSA